MNKNAVLKSQLFLPALMLLGSVIHSDIMTTTGL